MGPCLGPKFFRKQTPIFSRNRGSLFFQLFDARHCLASNCDPLPHIYFTCNFFMISWKKLYGHNPVGIFNNIGFLNFTKVECWLKIRILKMLSKRSVSSTYSATLETGWHLCPKITNLKKRKLHFRVKLWSMSNSNDKIFLKL